MEKTMKLELDFKPHKCPRCGWTLEVYKKGHFLGELSHDAIKKYYPKWYKDFKTWQPDFQKEG